MANSVDPDQAPRSAASDLDLHCLLGPICPKSYSMYCNRVKWSNRMRDCLSKI